MQLDGTSRYIGNQCVTILPQAGTSKCEICGSWQAKTICDACMSIFPTGTRDRNGIDVARAFFQSGFNEGQEFAREHPLAGAGR